MREANPAEAGSHSDAILGAGDTVPDFEAQTLDGRTVRYRDIWQNKLLVLVRFASPESEAARAYRRRLVDRQAELTANDTVVLVATRLPLPFPAAPGLVIADRWGEVRWIAHPDDDAGLPPTAEIIEWLRFVQMECPECQGETR